jgi:hypothetical protein
MNSLDRPPSVLSFLQHHCISEPQKVEATARKPLSDMWRLAAHDLHGAGVRRYSGYNLIGGRSLRPAYV